MVRRSSKEITESALAAVHASIRPLDVFAGENQHVTCFPEGVKPFEAQTWRVSPLGVELVIDSNVLPPVNTDITIRWPEGSGIEAQCCKVVAHGQNHRGQPTLGLRFVVKPASSRQTSEQRVSPRWTASALYPPTGTSLNKARFNDTVYFRIADLSASGMRVMTSMRNANLLPKSKWNLEVMFPAVGLVKVRAEIIYVRPASVGTVEEGYLTLGFKIVGGLDAYRKVCGQYLHQFGTHDGFAPTLDSLKLQGFCVPNASMAFDFSYVRSEEDYTEVLALRKLAYEATLAPGKDAHGVQWGDVFDSRARILIAKHRGRPVATCRLVFGSKDDALEHEQFCSLQDVVPDRNQVMECSRVCTHPSFRGNELLLALFRFMMVTSIQSDRCFVLGNSTESLLKLYRRVGNKPIGASYTHPNDGKRHHMLLADVQRIAAGQDLQPLYWALIVAPVWDQIKHKVIKSKLGFLGQKRLALYQKAAPLLTAAAKALEKRAAEKGERAKVRRPKPIAR
ncbi:MAG: GNAT family N-acetyltransferase [Cytophagaceae bacterium]|nr:MAG: GNAT family N-acetyltransferase [Cytophagaceae bacterium]